MTRKGLGKGLGALLSTTEAELEAPEEVHSSNSTADLIDIRKIEPNRSQPRQYFDDAAMDELADSIRTYGIIQPLILKDCGDHYKIIAGERRFRAARLANLDAVPAIIKEYTELEMLQIALIENIQRQDLTPIEEALCYKRLMDDFFFSQEDIAGKIGKNRTAVSNTVRLLDLDERVQEMVASGQLTTSHARALLPVKDGDGQYDLAKQVAEGDLSVRAAENLVATNTVKPKPPIVAAPEKANDNIIAAYRQAEDDLKELLGAKVSITQGKKKGKIEIEYYSPEELDRLLGLLGRKNDDTDTI